jgi:hypothetical protein
MIVQLAGCVIRGRCCLATQLKCVSDVVLRGCIAVNGNASNIDGGQPMEKGRLDRCKKLLSTAIPETSPQADAPVFTMPVKSRESTSILISTYNNDDTRRYSSHFTMRWDNSNKQEPEGNVPAFTGNGSPTKMSGERPALTASGSTKDQGVGPKLPIKFTPSNDNMHPHSFCSKSLLALKLLPTKFPPSNDNLHHSFGSKSLFATEDLDMNREEWEGNFTDHGDHSIFDSDSTNDNKHGRYSREEKRRPGNKRWDSPAKKRQGGSKFPPSNDNPHHSFGSKSLFATEEFDVNREEWEGNFTDHGDHINFHSDSAGNNKHGRYGREEMRRPGNKRWDSPAEKREGGSEGELKSKERGFNFSYHGKNFNDHYQDERRSGIPAFGSQSQRQAASMQSDDSTKSQASQRPTHERRQDPPTYGSCSQGQGAGQAR